jgi:hypothetical protein
VPWTKLQNALPKEGNSEEDFAPFDPIGTGMTIATELVRFGVDAVEKVWAHRLSATIES